MASNDLCQRIVTEIVEAYFADAVLRYGGGREKTYALTSTGTAAIDLTNGNTQTLTLNANTTVTLAPPTAGTSCTVSLYVVQDATGGRTITWPASVKWPGGAAPTLSTAANARDLIVLETLNGGTTWYATLSGLAFA